MHEMGIAQSVIEIAERTLAGRPGATLHGIGLRLGELSGVDTESLTFCFDCLKGETACAGAVLRIERTAGDDLDIAFLDVEVPDQAEEGS